MLGKKLLTLLAMVLVTIFMVTLHRLIGLKFLGEEGFLHLGMRAMKVLLMQSEDFPWFRISRTNLRISFPTTCQYFWKNKAGSHLDLMPLGGASDQ